MSIEKGAVGSYTSTEALAIHRAVKLTAGSGTAVEYADAEDEGIGTTCAASLINEPVAVRHFSDTGTRKLTMAGAVSIGDTLYPAADGKYDDTLVDGAGQFYALEAATADLHVIECMPLSSINRRQTQLAYANIASSTSHENTTTAADLDESHTIDGTKLQVGDVIEVIATIWVEDDNSTDTLTTLLKFGTETIVTLAAKDVAAEDIVQVHAFIHIVTLGSSGSIRAHGTGSNSAPSTAGTWAWRKAVATEDISGDVEIAVNLDWSVAHADNEAELWGLVVKHHRR